MNTNCAHRITFVYAERSGLAEGHQWRTDVDDYYEGAVIAAAAAKPKQGIGVADGVDYLVLCDSAGAWGAGRLVKTFMVEDGGGYVRRALVDPTDVHRDVAALIAKGFKPEGPNGGTLRQSMPASIVDGVVILDAELRRRSD